MKKLILSALIILCVSCEYKTTDNKMYFVESYDKQTGQLKSIEHFVTEQEADEYIKRKPDSTVFMIKLDEVQYLLK